MDLNQLISYLLRIGVLASVLLAAGGLAAWAASGYNDQGIASRASIDGTILSSLSGNPAGLIYLGIAVLIATPVLRVGLSTLYFSFDKDKKYVLITLAVLAMLIFALLSGSST